MYKVKYFRNTEITLTFISSITFGSSNEAGSTIEVSSVSAKILNKNTCKHCEIQIGHLHLQGRKSLP